MSLLTTTGAHFKDRRRWWVALLMLFPTGAGYIYVGRPWRFVVFSVVVLLSLTTAYFGGHEWPDNPVVSRFFIAAIIIAVLGFSIDLITIALKQNTHDLRWPQRRLWYVANLVIWSLIVFVAGM